MDEHGQVVGHLHLLGGNWLPFFKFSQKYWVSVIIPIELPAGWSEIFSMSIENERKRYAKHGANVEFL